MTTLTYEEFSTIRRSLLYESGEMSHADAMFKLLALAKEHVPKALHLLGRLHWEGVGVDIDLTKAFLLTEEAAISGDSGAMASLAAMYFNGVGCKQSWPQSKFWYQRSREVDDFLAAIRLGCLGLEPCEFRSEFSIEINGNSLIASDSVVERINRWHFECKTKQIDMQTEILDRNPNAFGGVQKWQLPYGGAIGGADYFLICGAPTISKLGFRNEWIKSQILFDWEEFSDAAPPISLCELSSCNNLSKNDIDEIRRASAKSNLKKSRKWTDRVKSYLGLQSLSPQNANELELRLLGTSVCTIASLYRDGVKIFFSIQE